VKKLVLTLLVLTLVTLPLAACGYQQNLTYELSHLNSELNRLRVNVPGVPQIEQFFSGNFRSPSYLRWFFFPVVSVWRILVSVGLGWLLFALLPQHIARASAAAEKEPLRAILYGLLGYLAIVPATVVLAITLIGIPLIPVLWFLVSIARLFGQTALGLLVGRALSRALNREFNETHQVILGLAALALLSSVPSVGGLVGLFTGLLGFGAALWTQFGRNAVV